MDWLFDYTNTDRLWDDWKKTAQRQREYARIHPCATPQQALDPRYSFRCGPKWNFVLTYEAFWEHPRWHVTATVCEVIGSENEFGLPREGLLVTKVWTMEHYREARDLMAMVLGEVLRDPQQLVQETRGLFALHWITRDPQPRRPIQNSALLS